MPRLLITAVTLTVLAGAMTKPAQGQPGCIMSLPMRTAHASVNQILALADWFTSHSQSRCAAEILRQSVKASPGVAALHYAYGIAMASDGKQPEAALELQQAVRLDPQFERAFLALGVLAHDRGDRNEALKNWQRVLQLNSNSITALDWIAKTRIEGGQYVEALDLLATAPESEELAIDTLVAANKAFLQEKGIASGQRVLSTHPEWTRLRIALATILVQHNRYEDALALLRSAPHADLDATDLQILTLRVLLLTGDTDSAKPLADRLLMQQPRSFDSLYLSGLLDRQTGAYADALVLLQRATSLEPKHFDAAFNLGLVYAKLHRTEEAKREFLLAADLPDASAEVHFQLANVLRATGDPASAEAERKLYQEKLAHRAQHDELVSLSAQAAHKLQSGDAFGAAKIERAILSKFPDQAVHWYDLAMALEHEGDTEGELTALEHAVLLRPGFAVAWNQLGYVRVQKGDTGGAEAAFQAALKSAPQYAEAENNLGSLLAQTGRDNEAQACFRAALASNPRLLDGWINLAASLASTGRYNEARTAAQSAMALQPGNPDIQRLLSMLRTDVGTLPGPH